LMHSPAYTRQFERDVKQTKHRGKNLDKLKIIARTLLAGRTVDAIHRDHRSVGNYIARRECHIESDWLLIYRVEETRIVFERTGTHSDLFR